MVGSTPYCSEDGARMVPPCSCACQPSWALTTGRLDHVARARSQGVLHARVPGVLITRLCSVLQQEIVADGVHSDQAKPPGKGLILRDGDVLRRHGLRQAPCLLPAVRDHLTLGDPLGLQVVILVKQFSASAPISALLALYFATLFAMDYSAHSSLLCRSHFRARSRGLRMAR